MPKPRFSSEPCPTPACSRHVQKDYPFCDRCWLVLSEDERAGAMFACHAPFWSSTPFYPYPWPEGSFHCDDMTFEVITSWRDTPPQLRMGHITPGYVLNEYERRTTIAAVAHLVYVRRMSQSALGRVRLANEGIEPQDQPLVR